MGTTQALHMAVGRRVVNQSGGTRASTPKKKFSAQIDVSLREDYLVSVNSGCMCSDVHMEDSRVEARGRRMYDTGTPQLLSLADEHE